MAIWRRKVKATVKINNLLEKIPCLNKETVSDRIAIANVNCPRQRTVKTIVCQCESFMWMA